MTHTAFYKLVLGLWGEDWRPELKKLLARHGLEYSRMTVWYWRTNNRTIPDKVATILEDERKARKAVKKPTAKGIAP